MGIVAPGEKKNVGGRFLHRSRIRELCVSLLYMINLLEPEFYI